MWWHGWKRDNLHELASALTIGHIIECSTYATGGYYSGFKDLGVNDTDMGCKQLIWAVSTDEIWSNSSSDRI